MEFLLPGIAALIYPFGAIFIKRAIDLGVGPWRTAFVSNTLMGIVNLALLTTVRTPFPVEVILPAALTGGLFFLGQLFTFLSLTRGDVSLATPVLGTKVVFVALLTALLLRQPLSPLVQAAVVVTTAGVVLLQWGRAEKGRHPLRTVVQAALAALFFSCTDISVQENGPRYSPGWFVPMMFGFVALYSIPMMRLFSRPLHETPKAVRRTLYFGAFLFAFQAMILAVSFSHFGQATVQNVVYNSRGLWSVMLVWLLGRQLGSTDQRAESGVMIRRLIGAALILSAIGLVLA